MVTLGRKVDFARIGDMLVNRHDICAAHLKRDPVYDTVQVQLFLRPMKAAFTVTSLPANLGYPALEVINRFLSGRLDGDEITKIFDQRLFGQLDEKKE